MATKEELLEKAKELDIEGRSSMNKEELEKAVADAEGSSSDGSETEQKGGSDTSAFGAGGKDTEASDATSEEVQEGLSSQGEEALEEMGEDSEAASEADIALDASGPLHLEAPHLREMTGAVSEEHAKEQEELLKNKPDDYVGSVSEAGFDEDGRPAGASQAEPKGQPKDNLSPNDERDPEDVYEVRQEDVIDYPAPLAEREAQMRRDAGEEDVEIKGDEISQGAPGGAFHTEALGSASTPGARSRLFEQKAVFYTDGLSGTADHNHERAYVTPEVLQSNDPVVRSAGDESESEAFQEEKSDKDNRIARDAKRNDG
jgi:hypothetical protein